MKVQGLCQIGLASPRPQASLAQPSNYYARSVSWIRVMARYVRFYHWSKINLVLKFESMFLHVICIPLSFDMRIYLLVVNRKVYASGSPVLPVSCNQSPQSCTNVLDCCCINRALGFRWNIFYVHLTLCFKHDLVRWTCLWHKCAWIVYQSSAFVGKVSAGILHCFFYPSCTWLRVLYTVLLAACARRLMFCILRNILDLILLFICWSLFCPGWPLRTQAQVSFLCWYLSSWTCFWKYFACCHISVIVPQISWLFCCLIIIESQTPVACCLLL